MRTKKGFTLIELIVVIGILAVLASALIAIFNPFTQFQKANDAKRKSDLSQIQKSLEVYYQDNGRYPSNTANYGSGIADYQIISQDANDPVKEWGTSWQPYINILPKDPNSAKRYVYYVSPASNGQGYYLYASLDRAGKDPQACNTSGTDCVNVPAPMSCGYNNDYNCNYGISSPNLSP
ncbi:MAG: prepilin-type N-terminal cleavage/methylation domain-containing protein [Candidatus Levybacteria bacterium]|nr:prepilin-type N-terminal cleavage/methylation domain-containing protein [Candidatus Levybacteria bacterium]